MPLRVGVARSRDERNYNAERPRRYRRILIPTENDTRALLYRKHLDGQRLALSFMTLAELRSWAVEGNWGGKKLDELRNKLKAYVVVHTDQEIVERYAAVRNIPGFPVNVGDAWIAATALRHAVPLVPHNRKHFENIPGLTVVSEA